MVLCGAATLYYVLLDLNVQWHVQNMSSPFCMCIYIYLRLVTSTYHGHFEWQNIRPSPRFVFLMHPLCDSAWVTMTEKLSISGKLARGLDNPKWDVKQIKYDYV